MKISFDPEKRRQTFSTRGLDFADAAHVFAGPEFTDQDLRYDYPEPRFQTYGLLDGRMIMFAWTPTDDGIRVISMRKCNEREKQKSAKRLG